MPGFWMYESTGVLRPAVEAYLNGREMTDGQVGAMRAYLRQWIADPSWTGGTAVSNLREAVDTLDSRGSIHAWLELAGQIGIDPL